MAQPDGIEQLNPAWFSVAVALIALIWPELTALYRRRFQPGSVEPVETGLIEVSYGSLGPTVAALGTVHAWQRDYLVRRIELTVTRDRDKATHHSTGWRSEAAEWR
jgi:hypothetical protein